LCADAEPDLAATRREAQLALELVPGAVAWVERLGVRNRIGAKTFAKQCAPTMVRCAVNGVVVSRGPDCDRQLRALLEVGIAACPAPDREIEGIRSAASAPGREVGSPHGEKQELRHLAGREVVVAHDQQ
jgi:hypothetical protein